MKLLRIENKESGRYLKKYDLVYENKEGKEKHYEIVSHHEIAKPEDLVYAGHFYIRYEQVFHGALFRDNEYANVFVYRGGKGPCAGALSADLLDISGLTLQESEVDEVQWFDLEEVREEIRTDRSRFCVAAESLEVLRGFLAEHAASG